MKNLGEPRTPIFPHPDGRITFVGPTRFGGPFVVRPEGEVMKHTVWVVDDCSYSEPAMMGLFATEELAQAFCDRDGNSNWTIEEVEVHDSLPEGQHRGES